MPNPLLNQIERNIADDNTIKGIRKSLQNKKRKRQWH